MPAEWLYSAEVRWFYALDRPQRMGQPPQPPPGILAWFGKGLHILNWPPKPRTDRYLLLPGCTTAGVKLREGRFEVKALCGTAEPVTLAHGITGLNDKWVKWSYGGGEVVDSWTAALNQETAGWLDVTKWRLQRFMMLSERGMDEITEDGVPAASSTVELTVIGARDRFWWTLGLEAVGELDKLDENFNRLADYFFGSGKPPVVFEAGHSYSYPGWIDSFMV